MSYLKDITIYDLARELGISIATVSRALNDDPAVSNKTKKKIYELAQEKGYRHNNFASSLRKQKTNTIGVIIPKVNSSFMSAVIAGIENIANKEGYNLLISQSSEAFEKEVQNVKTMFNSRVDGLLVSLAYNTDSLSHFDPFMKRKIPVIFFDRGEELDNYTNIVIDNVKAAYEATNHLTQQGCKKIAHVTADSKRNVYVKRLEGYKQALKEAEISFNEDLIIHCNLTDEAGNEAAASILKMNEMPDGVFVANDNCAVGLMLGLKKAGIKIPGDIAVVGFNNDPISRVVEPNLTTVNYPGQEMGEVAARNLINHLKGITPMDDTNKILLQSELLIRESTRRKNSLTALNVRNDRPL